MARKARKVDGERRTEFIGIWLTPSEQAELNSAAKLQGACLSTYTREALFRRSAVIVAATRRNPEAAEIILQLSALGNNLNQIARRLNELALPAPQELEPLLGEIRSILASVQAP